MREIKFRAWDKEENDFINKGNPFSFGDLSGKTHGFMFTDPTRRDQEDWFSKTVEIQLAAQGEKSRYILMQYTGLKDKDGKEIYEGDIVELKNFSRWHSTDHMQGIYEVWYSPVGLRFEGKKDLPLDWGGTESIKKLGNIYENKELLNGNL